MKHPLFNRRAPAIFSSMRDLSRRRTTRLTSDGTTFILFTFAISLAAVNTGNNLFYLILSMMLSCVVISGLLSEYCLRRLAFHRHLPDLIMANEPATLTLSIANRNRRFSSFSLRLFDVVGGHNVDRGLFLHQLLPQSSLLLSYPLCATRRGRLRLEGIRVQTLFPFGLFRKTGFYPTDTELVVAPPIKPLTLRFVDELVSEGQGQSLSQRGRGTQLYNLRLYQPGDDSRAIHWMTTARTSQLIVRETEAEDQRLVTVILSLVAPDDRESLFERSVTFVASLLWQLTERAYPVRLIVGREDSGFGSGSAHLFTLLRVLGLCERQRPEAGGASLAGEELSSCYEAEEGYRVAVVPWSGPAISAQALSADRVLDDRQLEELTHDF